MSPIQFHGMNRPNVVEAPTVPSTGGDGQYLTMDSLMTYCQSRLHSLDTQAQDIFRRQQKCNDDAGSLNNVLATLESLTGGVQLGGRTAHDIIGAYQLAINKVGADTPLGAKLTSEMNKLAHRLSPDGKLEAAMKDPSFWTNGAGNADDGLTSVALSAEDMKPFTETVKGFASDLNHDSELNMVSLQSIMSQRQMAIQVVTNLVQSLGDMSNKIAANIGH